MLPDQGAHSRPGTGPLAIALAAGADPRAAAWTIDSLSLYVVSYALEISLVKQRQKDPDSTWTLSADEVVRRFKSLPAEEFPQTRRHTAELTAGTGHERFDYTLEVWRNNLAQCGQPASAIGQRTPAKPK